MLNITPLHKVSLANKLFWFFVLALSVLFNSCKKITYDEKANNEELSLPTGPAPGGGGNCNYNETICEDQSFQELVDENEDDNGVITVLGDRYNNPYSLENMTIAYNYIYSRNIQSVRVTHYYIRVKPNNIDNLNLLDSIDVELYDYPLDKHVTQDGDYWPEAYYGLGQNEYPWLYTVIEKGFNIPGGVQLEVLDSIYIPDDNQVLEDEAFYLTGNYDCTSDYPQTRLIRQDYFSRHPVPDDCEMGVLDGCGGGGCFSGCGGTGGTTPRPKPSGMINFKTYITNPTGRVSAVAPLQFVKIVGRRFLKIDKTFTDENGNFQFSKNFPKKVTIVVKFKTSRTYGQHSVRTQFTNSGFWKSMFPMKKNIGTYRGNNLQNLNYEFEKGSTSIKRKTRNWIAAVMMNTVAESRKFLLENSLNSLPDDLRSYLYAPGNQPELPKFDLIRRSNTPFLNQDRFVLGEILQYTVLSAFAACVVLVAVANPAIGVYAATLLFNAIPQHPDINIYYRTSDINSLTATKVSTSFGQQLGISYLSDLTDNNLNGSGREDYIKSRFHIINNYDFETYAPFGPGGNNTDDYKPQVIAIWEGFAQHFGHTLSDRIYGTGASDFQLQGKTWTSDINESSNKKYLEEFDPRIGAPQDYFNWIPVGLINDLIDSNIDPVAVTDNVSGFTYSEIQSALYNKPSTVLEFKDLLKAIKPAQASQIDQLFFSYGY